jgi:hypothetical protein
MSIAEYSPGFLFADRVVTPESAKTKIICREQLRWREQLYKSYFCGLILYQNAIYTTPLP